MLKRDEVEAEEERLRKRANALSDEKRKSFYGRVKRELRDPDTHAVLNWFFLVGLHHFYLGRWVRGAINICLVLLGVVLLVAEQWTPGIAMIAMVLLMEMWELFRSQIIVQDWNNRVFRALLEQYDPSNEAGRSEFDRDGPSG